MSSEFFPCQPRCQKCGSGAVHEAEVVDENGLWAVSCKEMECGRAIREESPESAWRYFMRPLMSEDELDLQSLLYVDKMLVAIREG